MRSRYLLPLTEREQQVLDLYYQGLQDKDIADKLDISHRTVDAHLHTARHKLGIGPLRRGHYKQELAAMKAVEMKMVFIRKEVIILLEGIDRVLGYIKGAKVKEEGRKNANNI